MTKFETTYVDHSNGYASASPNLPEQVCLYVNKGEDPDNKYIFSFFDADEAEKLGKEMVRAAKRSRTKAYAKEDARLNAAAL